MKDVGVYLKDGYVRINYDKIEEIIKNMDRTEMGQLKEIIKNMDRTEMGQLKEIIKLKKGGNK